MFAVLFEGFQTHRSALELSLLQIAKCVEATVTAWLIVMTCRWRWCSKKMYLFQEFAEWW